MSNKNEPEDIIEVDRKSNNFDFLRLAAAFMVLVAHCFSITGRKIQEPFYALSHGEMYLGTVGLIVFFVISGFLIAKSWDRHRDTIKYFWGRFLRIVPGLLCVVLLAMFVIGPLVSPYPVNEYFTNQTTWKYLGTVTIFYNPNELPGVFDTNPSPSGPNGALWTLAAEFFMYIMIALAAFIGLFYKRFVLLCTTVLTIGIYLYNNYGVGSQLSFIYKVLDYFGLASFVSPITGNSQVTAMLMTLFMIGAMYYLYRDRISYKPLYILIAVLLWVPTIVVGGWILQIATFILLPYAILGLAHIKLPYANNIVKYGDFSYGFYIYGAPVQQTIVYFLGAISVPVMFCISLICVTPFAVLSWHLVESRALKMKSIDISGMINKGYRSVLTNVNTVWSLENKK